MSDLVTSNNDVRWCICSDPENCTERVPGYRCKKDLMPRTSVNSQLRVIEPFRMHGYTFAEVFVSAIGLPHALALTFDTEDGGEGTLTLTARDAHDLMLWLQCALSKSSVPNETATRQTAWLIEFSNRDGYFSPGWRSIEHWQWTDDDPNNAMRFARREDAERMAAHLHRFNTTFFQGSQPFAAEHIWMGSVVETEPRPSSLADQIRAAQERIAQWPADVRAALGLAVETKPRCLCNQGFVETCPVHDMKANPEQP